LLRRERELSAVFSCLQHIEPPNSFEVETGYQTP